MRTAVAVVPGEDRPFDSSELFSLKIKTFSQSSFFADTEPFYKLIILTFEQILNFYNLVNLTFQQELHILNKLVILLFTL
jgi:hypothetical protein